MKIVKQVAIFVANQPGTLTRLVKTLAQSNIDILGMMVSDAVDHAVLRLVLDKPVEAIDILEEAGLLVLDTDVFMLEMDNKPGMLFDLGGKLADAGINIEYAYGGVNQTNQKGVLFVKTSDPEATAGLLS